MCPYQQGALHVPLREKTVIECLLCTKWCTRCGRDTRMKRYKDDRKVYLSTSFLRIRNFVAQIGQRHRRRRRRRKKQGQIILIYTHIRQQWKVRGQAVRGVIVTKLLRVSIGEVEERAVTYVWTVKEACYWGGALNCTQKDGGELGRRSLHA